MLSMGLLHVLNGDATRRVLDQTDIGGERLVWADVLHEGPVMAELATAEVRRIRAEYLFSAGYGNREVLTGRLLDQDQGLGRWYDFDEVVFWLEHDIYDQLLLIRHLAWLSQRGSAQARSRLVEVDRHFGRSTPDDLARMFAARMPVSDGAIDAGWKAWRAVTADDPEGVIALVDAGPSTDLPFLHGALARWLQEYPSVENGLSRTERSVLAAVEDGHDTLETCFAATQALEDREFLGDGSYLTIARKLADVQKPLMTLTSMGGGGLLRWRVALTRVGRDVMAGEADYVHANGLDRWVGGVYLSGFGPSWRWNGTTVIWSDWKGAAQTG
jgi:hypothetical protein